MLKRQEGRSKAPSGQSGRENQDASVPHGAEFGDGGPARHRPRQLLPVSLPEASATQASEYHLPCALRPAF